MLYSALIVDARDYIRKGLIQKLTRRFDSLVIAGEAADGEAALLKTEALRPDIVIIDCSLEKIDGFTYMEQVRARQGRVHFILLSDFDNFSYVQHALRLGAHDYLLKPVNNADLYRAVEAAMAAVDAERQQPPGSPAAGFAERCAAWANAARSEMTNDRLCRAMAENFSLPFPGPYFSFLAVELAPRFAASGAAMDALKYAAAALLAEKLSPLGALQCFYAPGDDPRLFCILNHNGEQPDVLAPLRDAMHQLRQGLRADGVAAVCAPCRMFPSLKEKCGELLELLRQQLCLPGREVLRKQDLRGLSEAPLIPDGPFADQLAEQLQCLPDGQPLEPARLDPFFRQLADARLTRGALAGSCLALLDACAARLPPPAEADAPPPWQAADYDDCRTLDDLRQRAAGQLTELSRRRSAVHQTAGRKIVAAIQARLETEYAQRARLSDYAARYYINQSYLSALFQQETGVNFSQYVTGLRLRRARELLETTDYSTGRIAELVGYSDRNYFASVFARRTGMTPMQYRAAVRAEKIE